MVKLVGYDKIISKKNGKEYTLLYVNRSSYPNENFIGLKCDTLILPGTVYDDLRLDDLGHDIVINYTFSGMRGYITGISVDND